MRGRGPRTLTTYPPHNRRHQLQRGGMSNGHDNVNVPHGTLSYSYYKAALVVC